MLGRALRSRRGYASISSAGASYVPANVFDSRVKTIQRDRAAVLISSTPHEYGLKGSASRLADYLREEVADSLGDRLADIKRRFKTVVEYGSGAGYIIHNLDSDHTKRIIMVDSSHGMLHRDVDIHAEIFEDFQIERIHLPPSQEEIVPFEENSQECIVSPLNLHWINDLPGVLTNIQKSLQPDGVFICALLGGDTLFELRTSLQLAELEREGGISPRISPMTDSQSLSSLLSRAGFAIPGVDVDEIKIGYPSIFELMEDLQAMGETSALLNRRTHLSKDVLMAAGAIYKEFHGNPDGTIPATFQIIYGIGWKPAPTQQKPLERGSGKQSLRDVL